MVCQISSALAFIFLMGMMYTTYMADKTSLVRNYMAGLDAEKRKIYMKIQEERRMIYIKGFVLGLILSLIIIYINWNATRKMNRIGILCLVGSVSLITNYFYYILSPKTDWMILHVDGIKEKADWLGVYRGMQMNYHIGLVLGILGVVAIGGIFC